MDYLYIVVLVIVLFWLIFRLVTIQNRSNIYRCPHCRAEYQPEKSHYVVFSYLRCPQCRKRGWAAVTRKPKEDRPKR